MNISVDEHAEKDFEVLQIINSILASFCGLTIHCYILYRIYKNHSSLSHYQNLIVVQSVVGIVYILAQLVANKRQTLLGETLMSFSFLPFSPLTQKIMQSFLASLYALEQFLIVIFNIHRVLLLLRPQWIKTFYVLFTPFVLIYAIAFGVANSLSMDFVVSILQTLFIPSIIIISIVCFIRIKRYFRTNSGHTEKVKRMQARFSTSLYLEGFIHGMLVISVVLLLPLLLLMSSILNGNEEAISIFAVVYSMEAVTEFGDSVSSVLESGDGDTASKSAEARPIRLKVKEKNCSSMAHLLISLLLGVIKIILVVFRWYSVAIGALTLWSIYGFLK